MRIEQVRIRDFRNIADLDVHVPPAGLALVGENGQGKTNFLEAVYYLHLLRSVRGARDVDLVRFGCDAFHVQVHCASNSRARIVSVGFVRRGTRKRVLLDGVACERLSDALGAVPAVFFAPTDVGLASGAAAERRRYLDILLALTSPRHLRALQRYRAALARRGAALRSGSGREDAVAVWEAPLAESGSVLWMERLQWLEWAAVEFSALMAAIGETGEARLRYVSSRTAAAGEDAERVLAEQLARQRVSDLRRGITQSGPHRDDLELTIRSPQDGAERDLRQFGSAGQQRTAAVALRLLEARTLRARLGMAPLLLLDDPFAELDQQRATRILDQLLREEGAQVMLAVPRPHDVPGELSMLARLRVRSGTLLPLD